MIAELTIYQTELIHIQQSHKFGRNSAKNMITLLLVLL